MTGQLLTVREAATLTGRSVAFIRRLINDEKVRGRKDRGRWYVNRGSLDVWVACGSPDPEPPAKFYVCPEVVRIRGRGA